MEPCFVGARGGSDGVFGGGASSTVVTLGVDFVAFSDTRVLIVSWVWVRFGGRRGRFMGSKAGAIFLPASIDGVLDPDVLLVPLDMAEMEDMLEASDSLESRLVNCSDGLRGGNAGEAWDKGCLGGSRGGGMGFVGVCAGCCGACPVRVMTGGGSTPFVLGPLGSLPMPLPITDGLGVFVV